MQSTGEGTAQGTATTRARWARRKPSAAAPSRRTAPEAAPPLPTRLCPYCRDELASDAKKCRACGEWAVRTSAGAAAALLRLVGWVWTVLSIVAAAGVWYLGGAIRDGVLSRGVDPVATPFALEIARVALAAIVLLQGLAFGLGLTVLARLAPRRPVWWS
ncbi:MAG: hypothetical protein WKG32_16250 [Gemmatimonadaceae bacterium]